MKKFLLCVIAIVVTIFMLSSCAVYKKDCHGVKHYKHKGGFYI
jgi:hypothetical protein